MAAKKSVRRSKTVRSSRSKKPVARSSRSKKPARGSRSIAKGKWDNDNFEMSFGNTSRKKKSSARSSRSKKPARSSRSIAKGKWDNDTFEMSFGNTSRKKKSSARSSKSKKSARGSRNPFQEMIDNKVLSFNIKTIDKEKKKLEANRVKVFSSLPENPSKNTAQVAYSSIDYTFYRRYGARIFITTLMQFNYKNKELKVWEIQEIVDNNNIAQVFMHEKKIKAKSVSEAAEIAARYIFLNNLESGERLDAKDLIKSLRNT